MCKVTTALWHGHSLYFLVLLNELHVLQLGQYLYHLIIESNANENQEWDSQRKLTSVLLPQPYLVRKFKCVVFIYNVIIIPAPKLHSMWGRQPESKSIYMEENFEPGNWSSTCGYEGWYLLSYFFYELVVAYINILATPLGLSHRGAVCSATFLVGRPLRGTMVE